ncbi:OmpA family protein [Pseudoalteromonas sp. S16_S37]|uniref:OmpA family protein n=1 Tax=Pseudoalteromonas sp. S16_S37 TaxID=2720228 RepID=UPI0016819876|nr:OmpA family protein [Pseudoalteromonas sp. S16_S37]MBD1583965.1 OmpA family protein [Pseudoalteromonas sp. S16_S37]
MKFKSISLAIAALFAASTVNANEQTQGVHFGVFGDYYNADWNDVRDAAGVDVDDSTGWGAELGYRFNNNWSARLEYADMDFDLSGAAMGSVDGDRFGVDALYHFDDSPFYGLVGLKAVDVYKSLTFANVGAGYRHYFNNNFFVNAEAAVYQGLDRGYTDVGAKLGINYFFGSSEPVKKVEPAPAPVQQPVAMDSDKDGVMDADDRCADTPMSDAVDSSGCTKYEEREVSVKLLVRFPHDAAKVNQQYFDDINEVVAFMKEYESATVVLEGHASAVGDAKYNQVLSEKRAQAVAKQMMNDGISADRISTIGYGEERLKNTANTKEAHAQNRRVEATVTSTDRVKVKRQ